MAKQPLSRTTACPECGQESVTQSPRCRCSSCFARWTIEWSLTPEEFWSFNSSPKSLRFLAGKADELGVDEKALRILFNLQWDLDGREGSWIPAFEIPEEAREFAVSSGVVRESFELSHASLNTRIRSARDRLDRRDVAAAFLFSLTNRRLELRSPLGSLAHAFHLQSHRFKAGSDADLCRECGAEKKQTIAVNHNTFRRIMWAGNVLQGDSGYVLCDLEDFPDAGWKCGRSEKALLKRMLTAIRKLSDNAGLTELEKSISKIVPGNKRERQVALEILGSCGILKPKGCPSRHERWVTPDELPQPTHFFRKEWRSPTSCWTGADGINDDAVEFWFGDL
jgi:hypothetical protein